MGLTLPLFLAAALSLRADSLSMSDLPAPVFDAEPGYIELYEKAWRLAYDKVKYQPGLVQPRYMDEGLWDDTIWIWDTEFMALFCKYAPDIYPGIQSLDNFYCTMLEAEPSSLRIQHPDNPPFFAWVESEYYKFTNDKKHLKVLLKDKKYLQRYYEMFNNLNSDTRLNFDHYPVSLRRMELGFNWNGISSGMDNTPRQRGGKDMLWVDAISQQALSALYVSRLASVVGDRATALEFNEIYNSLKKLINENYWDEEDGCYYDILPDGSFVRVLTPASFWPLLAEIPSAEQVKRMTAFALNDSKLGGNIPWVTVSRDDKDFDAVDGNYWKGAVWLPTAYMSIKSLEKYGMFEEAASTAEDVLSHMLRTYREYEPHTIWECYSPVAPAPSSNHGQRVRPDFCGWSALGPISLFIENVLGFYAADAAEEKLMWHLHQSCRHGIRNFRFGKIVTDLIYDHGKIEITSNRAYTLYVNGQKYNIRKGNQTIEYNFEESIEQMTDRVFERAVAQAVLMDAQLGEGEFPKSFISGRLEKSNCEWWCSGFFPGTLWYIYEYTGNENILSLARKQTAKLRGIYGKNTNHDIGFQVNCSFGNGYRLTGDISYLPEIEAGAAKLAKRFNSDAGVIRSWDSSFGGNDWSFPVIIDNMMNLELLTNGHKIFGTDSLKTIALTHANTTMLNHFRDDYSCFHLVDYDKGTGEVRRKQTVQGYSDASAWARGQAWALYGYTMMFRETGVCNYLAQAKNIAKMLLERLPENGIPYWDFDSPAIPDDVRDASAAAVMASAFVELGSMTKDKILAAKCWDMAERQLRTLSSEEYLAGKGECAGFILKHSTGNKPNNSEVDVPLTYADYYFLEALIKLNRMKNCRVVNPRPVRELLDRVGGKGTSGRIVTVLDERLSDDGKEVFLISSSKGRPMVKGSSISAITSGIGWYLNHYVHANISWNSLSLNMSDMTFPIPEKEERHFCHAEYRYYLNYCTFSYSTFPWSEERWLKEVDWMALHGVNMPLMLVGTDVVWRNVCLELGFSEEEISRFIAGPAFQAWWLMGNLQGWGGPNPLWWYQRQEKLCKSILSRMRELGMEPVLPGYAGMMPSELPEHLSIDVADTGNWCKGFHRPAFMNPADDNFSRISEIYYRHLESLMGRSSYYSMDLFHEGGSARGVDLKQAFTAVRDEMKKASPESKWVIQSWEGNPTELALETIPHGDFVVIDLFSDGSPKWQEGYMGHEFVWCMLHNFGGRTGLHGRMPGMVEGYFDAVEKYPHLCKGIGAAPEGILTNPILYDLLFELPWMERKPELDQWIDGYVAARYGKPSERMSEAWKILASSALDCKTDQQGTSESIICARPSLDVKSVSSWSTSAIYYDPCKVSEADRLMRLAEKEFPDNDNYRFDATDVSRQTMADSAYFLLKDISASYKSGDMEGFKTKYESFLSLILEIDNLLAGQCDYTLDSWVSSARSVCEEVEGTEEADRDWMEWNARTLVSVWGPQVAAEQGGLRDYSNRLWSGMLRDFYYKRWKRFFKALEAGENTPSSKEWFEIDSLWASGR